MTGALIVTVGAPFVGGAADRVGARVATALLAAGVPVAARELVDEDEGAVEAALRRATDHHPLTVIIAGAGGAAGEVVRRTLARVTGTRLVLSDRMLRELEGAFRRQDRAFPRRLERLALLPQGAAVWSVEDGEPGFMVELGGGAIALLPPHEAAVTALLRRHLLPYARERLGGKDIRLTRMLRTIGLGLNDVEERLSGVEETPGATAITSVLLDDEVWIRLSVRAASLPVAQDALERVDRAVTDALGDNVYGRDGDSLERVVGTLLRDRHLMLAVAESCTGGLLGHRLTSVPGSSAYFDRGVMVYSNRAKQDMLDVSDAVLRAHGAVSAECAAEMATGITRIAGTRCGLAITGIAGPDGGSVAKPVGTVFIGLAYDGTVDARRFQFAGDREAVKWQSSQMALDMLRRALLSTRQP